MDESYPISTPVASSVSSNSGRYSASFKSTWLVPSTASPASSHIDEHTVTPTPNSTSQPPASLSTSGTSNSPPRQQDHSFASSSSAKSKYAASYNPTWAVNPAPLQAASVIAPPGLTQPPQPPKPPPRSRESIYSTNDALSAESHASGEARPRAPMGYAEGRSEGSANYSGHSKAYSWEAPTSSTHSSEARPLAPLTYALPSTEHWN